MKTKNLSRFAQKRLDKLNKISIVEDNEVRKAYSACEKPYYL